ncbi:hypothetical protein F4778DRAFT_772870 [Xylariomycetidae sp. FL2044]|nr:hypothetical protein F4778DRAFT_772870 [Xylariomycetidae sp. FL2044]
MTTKSRTHNNYAVGWVCALPKERTAAVAMLDERHPDLPNPANYDNAYTLGSIGKHNIVIVCLPHGRIGNGPAAAAAVDMVHTFPAIKWVLMVGIGGGIPSNKVRLGDVVVSTPSGQYPGVVQWDSGKAESDGKFTRTGALNNPPTSLLRALATLESEQEFDGSRIPQYLEELGKKWPQLAPKYLKSDSLTDVLFRPGYAHTNKSHGDEKPAQGHGYKQEDCQFCDKSQTIEREPREMMVHYGLIASGNQVIKDAIFRDRLNENLGGSVLCVEMEAAGLMDNFPCIVIRGICDYADSHKNKAWQEHAAAVAAAFAKELLGNVAPRLVEGEKSVKDTLDSISHTVRSVEEHVAYARSRLNKKEDEAILDWLTWIDYGPQQTDYFRRRQLGTGEWLLGSQEYRSWLNERGKTLFCPGMPGAGKTILTSIIVDDLESKFPHHTNAAIAYVYCNFNRKNEQTIEHLLSSLLKQLAQCQPSLPDSVQKLYDQHKQRRTRPPLEEISRVLQSVASGIPRVFIVIDALDECETADRCRANLLSEIFRLQSEAHVNILVTSRHIPDIEKEFQHSLFAEIRATDSDICRYLDGRMCELSSFVTEQVDLQDHIRSSITKTVNGMFLLAQLHFASLRGIDTPNDIREALQRLTTGEGAYDEAYKNAMKRIEGQIQFQARRAKQVLSWITCARRPLTKWELQHALGVKVGKPNLDQGDLPKIEDLVSVCAGLVTVDEESNVIRLVHYTTQSYFERTQERWFPNAQLDITTVCTTYLSFQAFANGHAKTDEEYEQRLETHHLFEYAALNWGHHARLAPSCQNISHFLQKQAQVEAANQALQVFREVWRPDYSQRIAGNVTGLHLAAYFGLDYILADMMSQYDVNIKDTHNHTPLWSAAWNGYEAAVKLLLDTDGVEATSKDSAGSTPLHWAAENGHKAVVKLLLGVEGADINWQPRTDTRLWLSCY